VLDTIARLEKLTQLRERQRELEQGLSGDLEGPSKRHRHDSPSPPSRGREIKFKSIPQFTLEYNLQRREDWLYDLHYMFEGAPAKFENNGKNKILAAVSNMNNLCRQRWYRHVAEKDADRQRSIQSDWDYFKEWTISLIRNAKSLESDMMRQLVNSRQRPGQDPREFHAYLGTLEGYFPRKAEDERALSFFAKLDSGLQRYMQEHVIDLPKDRDSMVSYAKHYFDLMHPYARKRKAAESASASSQPSSKRPKDNRPHWKNSPRSDGNNQSNAPRPNAIGKDGNRMRCHKCQSEYHFSGNCDKKDATIQSSTRRGPAKDSRRDRNNGDSGKVEELN
jgi:hypothetical protein